MPVPDFSILDPTTAKPALRSDLVFTPHTFGADPYYVVEDPARSKFFRIGLPEYTLISLFDGRTSISEAVGLAARSLGPRALSQQEALAVAHWLADSRLIEPLGVAVNTPASAVTAAAPKQTTGKRFNPLAIKLPLFDPDWLLDATQPYLGWLVSWPCLATWIGVQLAALYLVAGHWERLTSETSAVLAPDHWLFLAAAWLGLKILHESAHALACKKFGGNVVRAGVMIIFFSPVAFVDVTSSWRFRSKWQRIAVAAAGMYVELFSAVVALFVWANTSDGITHRLALSTAVMASLATIAFNANPLMRFDGYFILADLVGIPNLYSCSRQYLSHSIQRSFLGIRTALPNWSPATARFIKLYGLATAIWRIVLYITIVLAAISLLGYLGAILAAAWTFFQVLVPAGRSMRRFLKDYAAHPIKPARLALSGSFAAVAIALVAWLLAMPGKIEEPAIVDYAQLSVIRAGSPGFVREVFVQSGQQVMPGEVIAVLENEELRAELNNLSLAIEQSVVKNRIHQQAGEQAKRQAEAAERESLEKRQAEVQKQLESLVIRAPVAGEVTGRRLSSLVGQYLEPGEEIAVVGNDRAKELLIAASQEDIDLLVAQVSHPVRVRVEGTMAGGFTSTLTQMNPRATVDLPHPAFSAVAGGPLAVKPRAASEKDDPSQPQYELLSPRFVGKVSLSADESAHWHAGQRATVSFRSSQATIGGRLYQFIDGWIQARLGRRAI
jgi:putative peptide zinc metalloprotease protein